MANSADPDQLASSEANWSGSTLFAKTGIIRVHALPLIQEGQLSVSGERMCTILVNRLED